MIVMNICSEKEVENKILEKLDSPSEKQKLIDRWRSNVKWSKLLSLPFHRAVYFFIFFTWEQFCFFA
jgi:hypothetical protein